MTVPSPNDRCCHYDGGLRNRHQCKNDASIWFLRTDGEAMFPVCAAHGRNGPVEHLVELSREEALVWYVLRS